VPLVGALARALLALGAAGAGCIESEFASTVEPGFDTGTPVVRPPDDTAGDDTAPEVAEPCNGRDDDGDGRVDEDGPDADGDGIADCTDTECSTASSVAESVEADADCLGTVLDPWNVEVEWQAFGADGVCAPNITAGTMVTPVVGHLVDDDGDGVAGPGDWPEVVCYGGNTWRHVLDGRDGSEVAADPDVERDDDLGVALADADEDGLSEQFLAVLGDYPSTNHAVAQEDATFAEAWRSDYGSWGTRNWFLWPQLADLDGDGGLDVITPALVVNVDMRSVRFGMDPPDDAILYPAVADLDGDGTLEVVVAGMAYDASGALLWESPREGKTQFSAAIQSDADAGAEVLQIGRGFSILDGDGTTLVSVDDPESEYFGPPCVADFDGDGDREIGLPVEDELRAYEMDGSLLWTVPQYRENFLVAACTAFDFDADGAFEIVHQDEDGIHIFDGRTGTVVWESVGRWVLVDNQVAPIVDVDGDGSAEFLETGIEEPLSTWATLTSWGHADKAWPPAGPSWNTHDFSYANYGDYGEVPRPDTEPYWLVDGGGYVRARPTGILYGVDLAPEMVDICAASCEPTGVVQVALRVANHGMHLATRVSMTVARGNGAVLATLDFGEVAGASATASQAVDLWLDDFAFGPVVVTVDSPAYNDCNAADDVLEIARPCE
jgi:hypothetical protein